MSGTSAFIGFTTYLVIRLAVYFVREAVSYAKASLREPAGGRGDELATKNVDRGVSPSLPASIL
jgi:hypothetical protein